MNFDELTNEGKMSAYTIKRFIFLLIILSSAGAVQAQTEQPARTWIGGGITFTHSTANDARRVIVGAHLDAAYDLDHGFQGRFSGEYLGRPRIPNLFTGDDGVMRATSELRYEGSLVGYLPIEGDFRPFVGGGVSTTRHFFESNGRPGAAHRYGARYGLYNSSVNPFLMAGAGLGRKNEVTISYYFPDTYSYSRLRGLGVDFRHIRRISGRLHLQAGVRAGYWIYREGNESYNEKAGEFSGFIGFYFQ
jgi:hypothetical protein